jgi:hypothetical protein
MKDEQKTRGHGERETRGHFGQRPSAALRVSPSRCFRVSLHPSAFILSSYFRPYGNIASTRF